MCRPSVKSTRILLLQLILHVKSLDATVMDRVLTQIWQQTRYFLTYCACTPHSNILLDPVVDLMFLPFHHETGFASRLNSGSGDC